jgi:hypothetical protein
MGKSDNQDQVGWMDLRTLAKYACVCEKTLRSWINSGDNPLPAFKVGTKIYVSREEYDRWLRKHPVTSGDYINRIVDEVVTAVRQ